ncbi:MAG: DUF4426 domain-containing protein [Gammaproteobacteria bacterium]|jgi:hypothetical protein|nr:DUF4426 domain-containing protein [Gammaproteobacteria bacterium]
MSKLRNYVALIAPALMLLACSPPDVASGTSTGQGRTRLNAATSDAQIGNYVVRANAMNTVDLTPDVASAYEITRSEDRALVNLVVLRKDAERGVDIPVKADVSLSAANLTGQVKNVEVFEVIDGDSIYYLSEIAVENRETINFDFDIRPQDSDRTLLVRFSHEFYTR